MKKNAKRKTLNAERKSQRGKVAAADVVIAPPAVIGVLGGGQLASMLCEAGKRMGYRMWVYSEKADDPAAAWADEHFVGHAGARAKGPAWAKFSRGVDVLTNEFEQVPAPLLKLLEGSGSAMRVAPGSHVQEVCQDRRREKRFFAEHGFPCGPFAIVESFLECVPAYEKLAIGGHKVVAKTAHGGYDGKGQRWLGSSEDAEACWADLGPAIMFEQAVPFVAEASVIAARSPSGQSASFPMFRNEHREGILFQTCVPGGFSEKTERAARAHAEAIAEKLGVVGLLAVEMFVLADGSVLMNELAARPHNSGHVTLRACTRSQFEMHIAAICNLPLTPVELLRPAVMTNLLGDLWHGGEPRWAELFAEPHGTLHLYGKQPRPRRKMGHMIHTAGTVEEALAAANGVFERLQASGNGGR